MTNKNSRSTNNPYLTGITPQPATRLTLSTELKRLLGSPLRLLETLLFALVPLLLALAGALDLLTGWLYTVSHHVEIDDRLTVKLVDCLLDHTKSLCQGQVWASPNSSERIVLYPWHGVEFLQQFEPGLFLAFFALAILSFSAIGSPNATRMGKMLLATLRSNKGVKQAAANRELALEVKNPKDKEKGKEKEKNKRGKNKNGKDSGQEEETVGEVGIIPALDIDTGPDSAVKAWQSSLILGGYLPRMWESDPGYFYLNREERPAPYWLTLNMLRTNLVIVAPQGSGKTYSVYRPMLTFMRRSHSVAIFWDSKGDDFDPAYFDYNFDPENPAVSIKLNIFAGQSPTQAGERLAEALIPDLGGDKQYFSNNAKDAMAALTAAHNIVYERNPKLVDLLNYLTNPQKVLSLHDMVLESQRGPERYEEALRMAALLRRVMQLAENKNTDVLGSLATALNPLVTGTAAKVLVTNPDEDENAYTIEELLKKPGLIHLSLPVAKSPRLAPILGRLVLSQFTYSVLSPDCNRALFKMAAVDEARHFITENVANGMAQARSNNAGYVLALQTLTQIKDESLLDTIFAVSGTKIVMAGVGEKDARRFSDTFGQLELPYVNHSQGQSTGATRNNGSSYTRGQEYEFFGGQSGHEARSSRNTSNGRGMTKSQSTNSLTSTRVRPRFFPAEIRELSQFLAVVESSDAKGRRWFAQVIDMRSSTVNRLENRVLEQLRHLRDLQSRSSASRKVKHANGTSSTDTEIKEEVVEPGNTEKALSENPTVSAPRLRPRLYTIRFMPPETGVPKPVSRVAVENDEAKQTEQQPTPHLARSGQADPVMAEVKEEPILRAKEDPKLEDTTNGFPPVTTSTGTKEQTSPTQTPTEAVAEEFQSVKQQDGKEVFEGVKNPLTENKVKPFVQTSFLNNPASVATPDVDKATQEPVEIESSPVAAPAPKNPRKKRVARVAEGEVSPKSAPEPSAASITVVGTGVGIGKEIPADPTGLL